MKKSTIPGTKILKIEAGKSRGEEKLRVDLAKIEKIGLWSRMLKKVFRSGTF